MKKFLMICMLFSMAACSGNKEENKDLATKKAELDNLTKERDAIVAKIATLETEIQKMSGATVEEKTKLVEVTELITQDFAHYIDLQGKITTENLYYVTPRGMGGQVKAIFVKQGDNVKAGQLLMKLEDGIIQQNIKQVESQLEFAKNIFTRQENLWKEGIGTEVQFLSAKNNVEGLEKQLSLERKFESESLQQFLEYANSWWQDYKNIRPSHKTRLVKIFAETDDRDSSVYKPVCSMV
jgi:multidrug efflux pump subunit AcrA (membrane-fusion protein)